MKTRKKIALGIAVAMVLVTLISVFVFPWREPLFRVLWLRAIHQAQQRRVLLLCKTDHPALLKAGREILSKVSKDRLNPQSDGYRYLGDFAVPKGVRTPQAIRNLRPRGFIISYDNYLTVEMHGGMDHFGVKIYPEDFREPHRNFEYGDRELLPGLWYYDDGYLHNPEYDKMIETLIEEYKGK
jgi:hypothetical protein